MTCKPIIGTQRYKYLKSMKTFNHSSGGAVTKEGICLIKYVGCVYTVGFKELGLPERVFVLRKSKKGEASAFNALLCGLKNRLTIESMRNPQAELKLNEDLYYSPSRERELGGSTIYEILPAYIPTFLIEEDRRFVTYFPATRKQVGGW